MYDVAQLKTGLLGATPLVSWRQNTNPADMQLTGTLIATPTSGLYFNDFHPLLTNTNLLSIAPNFDLFVYPTWSASVTYVIGDIVVKSAILYRAILGGINHTPPNATYWEVYTPFTAWLREKTEAGIIQAIDTWLNEKFKVKTARNLLEKDTIFKTATGVDKDDNDGDNVGFEFVPLRNLGIKMTVTPGIQLDENCTVTLKLRHNGVDVQSQNFAYTGAGALQWTTYEWVMEGEGSYLLYYDQSQNSGVQSINGLYDYTHWLQGYVSCGKFYKAVPFKSSDLSLPLPYTYDTNFGLNFKLNVQCDYTTFILEQKNLFKQVIGLQVAINLLNEMIFNPGTRVNRNESNMADKGVRIAYELDGDSTGVKQGGLRYKLKEAMGAIQFDDTNIIDACLPCRKRGVRYSII